MEKKFPGSFWFKVHVSRFQSSGIPDLVGWVDGVPFAFETKRPGEEHAVTKIQRKTHAEMRKAGVNVFVISSKQAAVDMVKLVQSGDL